MSSVVSIEPTSPTSTTTIMSSVSVKPARWRAPRREVRVFMGSGPRPAREKSLEHETASPASGGPRYAVDHLTRVVAGVHHDPALRDVPARRRHHRVERQRGARGPGHLLEARFGGDRGEVVGTRLAQRPRDAAAHADDGEEADRED